MGFKVIVTKDVDAMSKVAGQIMIDDIKAKQDGYILGLATGNTPCGAYKVLAEAVNKGDVDPSKVTSFNLDEYVGLPGENAAQRVIHPESYGYFMIQELFGHMEKKFKETFVPWGALVDQKKLQAEMDANKDDWSEEGTDKGKAIVIKDDAKSEYLSWIKKEIIDGYVNKIDSSGGIDLHIVGVGGRGHVAFHESGIPLEHKMLLVKLDDNTVDNAVNDGHFPSKDVAPWYATSMGAGQVYKAKTVLLVANGERKTGPIAESLLGEVTADVPISYGQTYAKEGGNMIYVLDEPAAKDILDKVDALKERGIELEDQR
jgi:glucosamine-6-phosphate deaminase